MTDYSELKRLAEACRGWDNMTSCWPDQEQDGDADISWIVGHVGEDGDKYPVLELNTVQYDAPDDAEKLARFYAGANPAAVLALIAENETLKAQFDECARLFVDATEQACKAQRERDQLKAENEAIRAALEVAALAMWNSEANMDSEAAAVEEALANAAMSRGEKFGG